MPIKMTTVMKNGPHKRDENCRHQNSGNMYLFHMSALSTSVTTPSMWNHEDLYSTAPRLAFTRCAWCYVWSPGSWSSGCKPGAHLRRSCGRLPLVQRAGLGIYKVLNCNILSSILSINVGNITYYLIYTVVTGLTNAFVGEQFGLQIDSFGRMLFLFANSALSDKHSLTGSCLKRTWLSSPE